MSFYDYATGAIARMIGMVSPRKAIEYQRAHQILNVMRDYDAAKLTGHNQNWRPTMKSGDAEMRAGAQEIRNRVKSLERNNIIKCIITFPKKPSLYSLNWQEI